MERFGTPGPRLAPSVTDIQVVGLETWLAIDPVTFTSRSWTKDGVSYVATPTATVFEFADMTVRCGSAGVEYTPGAAGPAPCGRDWEHTTSVAEMWMKVRVEFDVAWSYQQHFPAPEPVPLPPDEFDEDGDLIEPSPPPPPPPPPPPVTHSGVYADESVEGEWDLRVGEIQTFGTDGDGRQKSGNAECGVG